MDRKILIMIIEDRLTMQLITFRCQDVRAHAFVR